MPLSDDLPAALPAGAVSVEAVTLPFGGPPRPGQRLVPEEVPVNITYATVPYAVMMATPADLEDFAYGFSLTEGVIAGAADIRAVTVEAEARGLRLQVDLVPARLHAHLARRRSMVGRTGCGLCGIEDLDDLPQAASPMGPAPALSLAALRRALSALETRQALGDATRGAHAAGFATATGELALLREDVGRHNALDKLAGAMLRNRVPAGEGFVIVTSRCSFEMVEKAAAMGARALVAISAPTSLALERARQHDMILLAIARRDAVTAFHGAERLRAEGDAA